LVGAILTAPSHGQDAMPGRAQPRKARGLYLKQGLVDTAERIELEAEAAQLAGRQGRFVMQLDGPMDPVRRARLEASGVTLGDYLPSNAYIVRLNQANGPALAELDFVRWVGRFQRQWKLDPQLGQRELRSPRRLELARQHRYQVVVVLFEGEDPDAAAPELELAGATVQARTRVGRQWMLDATVPMTHVGRLADIQAVQYVEEAPEGSPRNDTNEWIVQSNQVGHTPVWAAGLQGQGQLGGLIDGTMKESHCAFDDSVPPGPSHRKIVALRDAGSIDSHGTHTAGTLAGDAGIEGAPDQYDGIAFAAKISFTNVNPIYTNPSTLYPRLVDAHNDGARVHSNSWGDDTTTDYTTWCRQIDQFSHEHEDSLVVFAVTNTSTLKTPENAKNVLAVAASRDTPSQDLHCSGGTGPTSDAPGGRRKPEVYAPGCSTLSASSSTTCDVSPKTGTSMACPAVSGAGLLVRQYFTEGYYPSGSPIPADALTPSGALIKAVLINSAVDMTGISGYPSDQEGWGRILLDNVLRFPGDAARLRVVDVRNADGLSTGQSVSYEVNVLDDSVPLQVTLVFTEPPAAVNASDPVINNLDLEVVAPDGSVYRGNFFVAGQSAASGLPDGRNNVEQVLLNVPARDSYTITVEGTAVNQGPQGYALVVTGGIGLLPFDCNGDWVLDLTDFQRFSGCLSGPEADLGSGCDCADHDQDGDADLGDFSALLEAYEG
jgi:hypothetical protein